VQISTQRYVLETNQHGRFIPFLFNRYDCAKIDRFKQRHISTYAPSPSPLLALPGTDHSSLTRGSALGPPPLATPAVELPVRAPPSPASQPMSVCACFMCVRVCVCVCVCVCSQLGAWKCATVSHGLLQHSLVHALL